MRSCIYVVEVVSNKFGVLRHGGVLQFGGKAKSQVMTHVVTRGSCVAVESYSYSMHMHFQGSEHERLRAVERLLSA